MFTGNSTIDGLITLIIFFFFYLVGFQGNFDPFGSTGF